MAFSFVVLQFLYVSYIPCMLSKASQYGAVSAGPPHLPGPSPMVTLLGLIRGPEGEA